MLPIKAEKIDGVTVLNVAFRVDSSVQIGAGHLVRCITLANAIRSTVPARIRFVCRQLLPRMEEQLVARGYEVLLLDSPPDSPPFETSYPELAHTAWLGASQLQDAAQMKEALGEFLWDWLIVDHYAIDRRWQQSLRTHCKQILVIDDLADRQHDCNVLLDQTFGRATEDYRPLVPVDCQILCGSEYSLLRPDFASLRAGSLQRRAEPILQKLLITMGGIDKDNATTRVLQALRNSSLPASCQITVVMGSSAPWLSDVRQQAHNMPWATKVLVDVSEMAQLMADSDLAIGAAGSTSWERCCLGLPTIMIPLADNQLQSCHRLALLGVSLMILEPSALDVSLPQMIDMIVLKPDILSDLTQCSAKITDGLGADRLVNLIRIPNNAPM